MGSTKALLSLLSPFPSFIQLSYSEASGEITYGQPLEDS